MNFHGCQKTFFLHCCSPFFSTARCLKSQCQTTKLERDSQRRRNVSEWNGVALNPNQGNFNQMLRSCPGGSVNAQKYFIIRWYRFGSYKSSKIDIPFPRTSLLGSSSDVVFIFISSRFHYEFMCDCSFVLRTLSHFSVCYPFNEARTTLIWDRRVRILYFCLFDESFQNEFSVRMVTRNTSLKGDILLRHGLTTEVDDLQIQKKKLTDECFIKSPLGFILLPLSAEILFKVLMNVKLSEYFKAVNFELCCGFHKIAFKHVISSRREKTFPYKHIQL